MHISSVNKHLFKLFLFIIDFIVDIVAVALCAVIFTVIRISAHSTLSAVFFIVRRISLSAISHFCCSLNYDVLNV